MPGSVYAKKEMSRHRWSLFWMFFCKHFINGKKFLIKVYPDMIPKSLETQYTPKVYGFKIFERKGSKYEKK